MLNQKLCNAIIDQQGDLLYTTLAEECSEVIQACSKIIRKKYYNEQFDISNLLEEIGDLEINLQLIKQQLGRENTEWNKDFVNKEIKNWQNKKEEKLSKIFLK